MKKADLIIAAVVFIAGIVIMSVRPQGNAKVSVYSDGKLYQQFYYDNSHQNTETIRTKFGTNVIKVDKNGVCIIESTCKDKLEVKQGYINKPGQSLVCLPNRLVVSIDKEKSFEAVTY